MHVNDIVKVESKDDYVYVHDRQGVVSPRFATTLTKLAHELHGTEIVRVNNYTMLNVKCIMYTEGDAIFVQKDEFTLGPYTGKYFFETLLHLHSHDN